MKRRNKETEKRKGGGGGGGGEKEEEEEKKKNYLQTVGNELRAEGVKIGGKHIFIKDFLQLMIIFF
jgi:hypothetical protein